MSLTLHSFAYTIACLSVCQDEEYNSSTSTTRVVIMTPFYSPPALAVVAVAAGPIVETRVVDRGTCSVFQVSVAC